MEQEIEIQIFLEQFIIKIINTLSFIHFYSVLI